MVIMKITPTNAHAAHAQTDETRLRLGDGALLNAEVFRTVQYACFHGAVPFKVPWFGRPAGGMRNARGWGGGDFVLSVLRIKAIPPSASRSLATGNSHAGSRGRLPPCGVRAAPLPGGTRASCPSFTTRGCAVPRAGQPQEAIPHGRHGVLIGHLPGKPLAGRFEEDAPADKRPRAADSGPARRTASPARLPPR